MDPLRMDGKSPGQLTGDAANNANKSAGSGPGGGGGHSEAGHAQLDASQGEADASEGDYSALFNCVSRLYRDNSTSNVIRELIDRSRLPDNRRPASQAEDVALINSNHLAIASSSSYSMGLQQETIPGGQQAPPTSTSLFPPDKQLADNLTLLVDWTGLSKKLPAWESPYQLEALNESWQLYLTIIYTLTAVTSFILNAITVIVLTRSRRSELRKYLINLSVSDLLMSLFSIPFTYTEYMLGRWIFAAFLCPLVRFVVTLSVFVSVATMTVIGINRHQAIMYPLKRKRYSKGWMLRKSQVIILIWLLGIGISMPEYLMFSAEPFCYNRQLVYDCRHSYGDSISDSYTVFIYLSTFVVPLMLLSYLYTSIGVKLWRRQMPGNVDVNRDHTMQCKRVKVVKMLLVVVVLFAVFWLPLQTFSMIVFLYPDIRKGFEYQSVQYNIFIATYFTFHWLSMAHSCLNPLIYCFMNDKFRSELRALICRREWKRQQQHQLTETNSTNIRYLNSVQSQSFKSRPQQQDHQRQVQASFTCTSLTNDRIEPTSTSTTSRVDVIIVRPTTSICGQRHNHHHQDDLASHLIGCHAFDGDHPPGELATKSSDKMLKLVNKLAPAAPNNQQQVSVQATNNNDKGAHKRNGQLLAPKVNETLEEEDEDEGDEGGGPEGGQVAGRPVDLVVVVGQSQTQLNCSNV